MQAAVLALSGMVSEHSRMASGVQACSALMPCAPAPLGPLSNTPAANANQQTKYVIRICSFPRLELIFRSGGKVAAGQRPVDGFREKDWAGLQW